MVGGISASSPLGEGGASASRGVCTRIGMSLARSGGLVDFLHSMSIQHQGFPHDGCPRLGVVLSIKNVIEGMVIVVEP